MVLPPDNSEKENKSFYETALRTFYPNLYLYLNRKTKDELARTGAGIGTAIPREGIELSRMVGEYTPNRSDVRDLETGKITLEEFKEKESERKLERLKSIEKQEDYIESLYKVLVGADNVTRVQRGDYSVAEIAQPETATGKLTRGVGEIAAGIALGNKLTGVKKAGTFTEKVLRRTAGAEVGVQLSIDPYNDMKLFPELIGGMIKEDDGSLGAIKEYLEADPQTKSQLQNRMDLLADGLLFQTGFWFGGKLVKGGWEAGKKINHEAQEIFRNQFRDKLDVIASKGQGAINRFLEKIKTTSDADSKEVALWHRKQDIKDGKVVDMGDIEALEPSRFTKWLSDINLQFSTSPTLRRLENYRLKLFSTRGGKSRKLNERFLKTENLKEQWSDKILNLSTNLEDKLDDIVRLVGTNKEDLLRKVNRVLYEQFATPTIVGPKKGVSLGRSQEEAFERALKTLPKELQEPVRQARQLQDRISKLMVESDILTDAQKKIYQDNYGYYVRRSYKLFEDPNYVPTPTALKDAKEFLGNQFRKQDADAGRTIKSSEFDTYEKEIAGRVDAMIETLLERGTTTNQFFADLNKFDIVRKSILQGRKDIPAPIKNLFGEVSNPIEKLIHSTTKVTKLYEDTKFYNDAYEMGSNLYFRESPIGIFNKEIPAGYGNLSGKYTNPEMLQYFSNYKTFGQQILESSGPGGYIYRTSLLLKGLSQAAKTVFSHATHFVNILGGKWMSLANGVNTFNPRQSLEIIKLLRARTRNDVEAQKFHEELSGRGILNKGVIARDLMGLANDIGKVKEGFVVGKIDWMFKKIPVPYWSLKNKRWETTSPARISEKIKDTYVAEDDFFKINMYLEEEKMLTKLNNALPDGHSLKRTSEEIKDEAALMVRDTLPNYDLVPEWLQNLRRNPFFGKFFSFMSESVRISVGTLNRGFKEIRKGKELISEGSEEAGNILKNRGIKRLAAFTTVAGAGSYGIQETTKAATGFTSDLIDAGKDFLADYMQNTDVIVAQGPDGNPMIADLGRLDPYQFPKQPVQILVNKLINDDRITDEGALEEIFNTIVTEMTSPFLGFSMIQEDVAAYFGNGRGLGTKKLLTNPFDRREQFDDSGDYFKNITNPDNINILLSNMLYDLVPASFTKTTDWIDEIGKERTEFDQDIYQNLNFLRFLTGIGFEPLNQEYIQNVYEFKANDFSKKKSYRRGRLFRAIGEELDKKYFIEQYLKQNQDYYAEFSKFHKTTKSAEKFNLDVISAQKNGGLAKRDRMAMNFSDDFSPLGLSDGLKESLLERAVTYEDYIDVITDINMLDLELSNLPVLFNPEHYKIQKEQIDDLREFLREQRVTGGLIEGPEVPFTKPNPADRVDPFTGRPYQNEIERIALSGGGPISRLIEFAGQALGVGSKEQRQNEKEAAALINRAVDAKLIPDRERVPTDNYGFVAGKTGDTFNAANHALLSYKYGDTFVRRTGLQGKEILQAIQGRPKDSALDALNNKYGMELRNRVKTQEEAEEDIMNALASTYSTLQKGERLKPGKNLYLNFEDI